MGQIKLTTGSAVTSAVAAMLLSIATASAQVNTFTSGQPPIGDGNDYPANLNPARQTLSGGASPGFYSSPTTGVSFQNLNGNPAYFDANNLLTRPATLISGDAFWTDPKIGNFDGGFGSFSVADIGVSFDGSGSFFESFGFDLAVASVSNDVPLSLPFQVQDDMGFTGRGELLLSDEDSSGSPFGLAPTTAGTFFSLNSPRVGREARYRIDFSQLQDLIFFDNEGQEGFDFPGAIEFFDIDLRPIATGGGTTQIAIDNFLVGDIEVPTSNAPTYVATTGPIGANRPQYFDYADVAPPNPDGDSYDIDIADLIDGTFIGITVVTDGPANPEQGAGAYTTGGTIFVDPTTFDPNDEGDAVVGHEVTHTASDDSPTGNGGPEIPADAVTVGTLNQFSNFIQNLSGQIEGNAVAPANQIVEIQTVLATTQSDAELAELVQQIAAGQVGQQEIGTLGNLRSLFQNLVDSGVEPINIPLKSSNPPPPGDAADGDGDGEEPMFYQGYSVTQYLTFKESLQQAILLGDQGSYLTPIYDDQGEVLTYRLSTWTVTDQSGLFLPILTNIPEPTTLALLAPFLLASRMRRRVNC